MTNRFQKLAAVAFGAFLATVPCTVSAQLVGSVAAGPTAAPGRGVGYQGAASLRMLIPRWSGELGLEGSLSSWDGTDNRLASLGLVFVHRWRPSPTTPYTVFGTGAYAAQASTPQWGVSAGFGVRFPIGRVQPFAELRVHAWQQSGWTRMTPFVVGVSF